MSDPEEVIRAAEEVAGILESRGVGAVVIGAVALAAHGYVRFTEDLDLGVNTDLGTLRQAADALRTVGFEVELREPDGQDPLGGVVDVRGPFGLVQIVNYGGRFPAVIEGGLAAAETVIRPGMPPGASGGNAICGAISRALGSANRPHFKVCRCEDEG